MAETALKTKQMNKIKLEKETKVKLLLAIQNGEIDIDEFPELRLNSPQYIDVKTLTDEQLDKIIESINIGNESKY